MKKILSFLFSFIILLNIKAQKSLQFNSVDSLFAYAENNSASIKTGNEQSLLAKWTKLAAFGNTINLRSPISATWTDNTELPVSYVPAEKFGGVPGTLQGLSFGQEYVTNYSITPQIDIINLSAWARIKSATINQELTETTNLISKKNLFESVAAAYHNIISMQNQIEAIKTSIAAADTILTIVTNKFNQGIIREQDKNNASINLLTVQDKLAQLNSSLEQQYNTLKLLCDIQPDVVLQISNNSKESIITSNSAVCKSALLEKQNQLQSDYLKSEFRSSRLLTFAPTLSFIFNQAWQQSSNVSFTDSKANHFTTQYFGLKLSVPLPFDVTRLSQNYTSKINYTISKINEQHGALQNQINNKQLELDYQKAISGYTTSKKVSELKEVNYSKSMNQYKEGILSTENLLLSFTDKINAELNLISASASLQFVQSKIKINNTIQ
jgi:outer membrane protein